MSILLMSDLRASRARKQAELDFYGAQLRVLKLRMAVVQQEVDLTTRVIDLIEHEVGRTVVRAVVE